jgi:hypothetical protein
VCFIFLLYVSLVVAVNPVFDVLFIFLLATSRNLVEGLLLIVRICYALICAMPVTVFMLFNLNLIFLILVLWGYMAFCSL